MTSQTIAAYARLAALPAVALAAEVAFAADNLESSVEDIASQIVAKTASGERTTIGISTFIHGDGTCSDITNFISELVVDSLFNAGGDQVRIVERSQLSAIFKEMKLVYDGTIAPDTAKKLGEIEGVDALVTGTVTKFGDQMLVQARLIGTADGTVFATARSRFPRTDTIREMTEGRSRADCGFEIAGTVGGPTPGVVQSIESTSRSGGNSASKQRGFGVFEGEGFVARLVGLYFAKKTGELSASMRIENKSEGSIGLSFLEGTLNGSDGKGGFLEDQGKWAGLRACSGSQLAYCTTRYPKYATTVPAGKSAQANFTMTAQKAVEPGPLSISMEFVLTPDAQDPSKYKVVSLGFFDLSPVVR